MMRWLIVVLATVVLMVVGAVVIRCEPETAGCPTYMAGHAAPASATRPPTSLTA